MCVIRDQGKGFYDGKSIELYITIWKLNTHKALLWFEPLILSGSCVQQRLMKASHLEDRLEDGARTECYQRDPNNLWELKHQRSLPLHKLPLICLCSLQAIGYPVSKRERREYLIFYLFLFFLLEKKRKKTQHPPTLCFSSGYLVQPNLCSHRSCHCTGKDMKRGYTKKKYVEGYNCWKWHREKGDRSGRGKA